MIIYTFTKAVFTRILILLLTFNLGAGINICAQGISGSTLADPAANTTTRMKVNKDDSLYLLQNHPYWYEVAIGPIPITERMACSISPVPVIVKKGAMDATAFTESVKSHFTLGEKAQGVQEMNSEAGQVGQEEEKPLLSAALSQCFMGAGLVSTLKMQYLVYRNFVHVSHENNLPLIPRVFFNNPDVNWVVIEKAYEHIYTVLAKSYPEIYGHMGKAAGIGLLPEPRNGFHAFFQHITPFLSTQEDVKISYEIDTSKL